MFKVWKSASIVVILALVLSLGLVMAPMAGTAGASTLRVPEDYTYIQDAIDDANAGDVILVGPGEYYENLEIYDGLDGLTVKSTGGAEVTLIIGGAPREGMAQGGGPVVDIQDVNGVTFQGFTVVNGDDFYMYGIPTPGYGIGLINTSDCLIANNIVTKNEAGIFVLGGTLFPMPTAGREEGVGGDGGIELVSNGNIIRDNEVCDNGGGETGMDFGMLLINCNETTVKGNEVYENENGGICVIGGYISMMPPEGSETVSVPPPTFMGVARDNQITDNEIYYSIKGVEGVGVMMPPGGVILFNTLHNTISGNEIYNNYYGAIIAGATGSTPWGVMVGEADENVVSDNEIYNNYYEGVAVVSSGMLGMFSDLFGEAVGVSDLITFYANDNDVTDNTIEYNGHGVYVMDANNTRILRNDILNNSASVDSGVHIEYESLGTQVHFNNIEGNSYSDKVTQGMSVAPESYGVYNHPENPMLDATFNWWGDDSGPYDPRGETEVCPCTDDPAAESNADGEGDVVSYNVDYCPWLLEPFCPATSASSTTGEGNVGFNTSDWNSSIIQHLGAKDPSEICPPKPEMFFPYGIFSFTVLLKDIGGTVTVTITLPEDIPQGAKYWKCQDEEWVDATSLLGDDDGDNILTLTLTDGGLGDADGEANGVIDDPGGPAIPIPLDVLTGEGRKAVEPASFTSSYLRVTPPQASPNQAVEVSINVANTGEERGSRAVILYVNGNAEQSQTVTVAPGSSQNVVFTVTRATPGTYSVLVEGQRGQFAVRSTSVFGGGGLGTGGIIAIVVVLLALIVGVILVMRGAPGKA